MNKTKTIQLFRFLCLMAILLVMPTGQASAALRGCRTDPIFKLSNGDVLAVTLNVGTDVANIRSVVYVLHIPAGVRVTQVVYTGGGLAAKETYRVYQDSPARTYTTDTFVTTTFTTRISVSATTRLNGVFAKAAYGFNGDNLLVTVARP